MIRLLIIIPTDILEAVRAAAVTAFGDMAHGEFVPAGSPDGTTPATHYWLAGVFTDEEQQIVTQMQTNFPTAHVESYDLSTNPGRPMALLAEMELKPIQPQGMP